MISLFLAISAILSNCQHILPNFIVSNQETRVYIQTFFRNALPAILIDCMILSLFILLVTMRKTFHTYTMTILQLVCIPIHMLWCYLLFDQYGNGLVGVARAMTFTAFIKLFIVFVILSCSTDKDIKDVLQPNLT